MLDKHCKCKAKSNAKPASLNKGKARFAESLSTSAAAASRRIAVRLNDNVIKTENSSISAAEDVDASIVSTVRVKKSGLSNTTFVDTAKLEIFLTNTNAAAVTVNGTDARTSLTITFLG